MSVSHVLITEAKPDFNFEQLNQKVAYTSAGFGVPMPLHTQGWTCRACGYRWQGLES